MPLFQKRQINNNSLCRHKLKIRPIAQKFCSAFIKYVIHTLQNIDNCCIQKLLLELIQNYITVEYPTLLARFQHWRENEAVKRKLSEDRCNWSSCVICPKIFRKHGTRKEFRLFRAGMLKLYRNFVRFIKNYQWRRQPDIARICGVN